MIDLSGWIAIASLFITVAGSFGVFLAYRSNMASVERTVQDRVIAALKEEMEVLNRKYERQNSIISTILYVLKQRGLKITIDGDFVTLEESGKSRKVTRIQDRSAQLDDEAK